MRPQQCTPRLHRSGTQKFREPPNVFRNRRTESLGFSRKGLQKFEVFYTEEPERNNIGSRRTRAPRTAKKGIAQEGLPLTTNGSCSIFTFVRGCSSMVEHQLPKLETRVRFPSPAPPYKPRRTPLPGVFYFAPNKTVRAGNTDFSRTYEVTKGRGRRRYGIGESPFRNFHFTD